MAIRYFEKTLLNAKSLVVIYKEVDPYEGFVLTAYFTNQYTEWRTIIWHR